MDAFNSPLEFELCNVKEVIVVEPLASSHTSSLDDMPLFKMMNKDLSLEIWTAHFDSLKAEKAGALKCLST
jgi:hypothetical protein